jgi:general secretion pathway protein A
MRDARVDLTHASPAVPSPYLTYEPYYGLKEKAFSLSADPRFLYKSRSHGPAFDELRAGIRRREGIILLTGEPGTGKTTLCRSVLASLDRKTFCSLVPDPFLSREDLLKMLLVEFGVISTDDLTSGRFNTASRLELSYPLYDFLRSLVPLQAYAVLIIDEAQNLTSQLLEEIRILSDVEGPEKLLQLVLVGQPELHDKMKDPAMRQLDQRVSVRCALQTLERDAVPEYIAHRLTVAGAGSDRVKFVPEAFALLYAASQGNPRVLNLVADKCLQRGHVDRTWIITAEIVSTALAELGYATTQPISPVKSAVTTSAPAAPPIWRDLNDAAAQFPIEESAFTPPVVVANDPRVGRSPLRGAAMAFVAGSVLAAGILGLGEWSSRWQDVLQPLPWPALPASPAQRVSAGLAPVVPPAGFFAPVIP